MNSTRRAVASFLGLADIVGVAVFFAARGMARALADAPQVTRHSSEELALVESVLSGRELMVRGDLREEAIEIAGIYAFEPAADDREEAGLGRAAVRFLNQRILHRTVRLRFEEVVGDNGARRR